MKERRSPRISSSWSTIPQSTILTYLTSYSVSTSLSSPLLSIRSIGICMSLSSIWQRSTFLPPSNSGLYPNGTLFSSSLSSNKLTSPPLSSMASSLPSSQRRIWGWGGVSSMLSLNLGTWRWVSSRLWLFPLISCYCWASSRTWWRVSWRTRRRRGKIS